MKPLIQFAIACLCILGLCVPASAKDAVKKHVTQSRAKTILENLYKCPVKVGNHRVAGIGQITATDGTVITVPAETALQKGTQLTGADLYNECNQITPAKATDVPTDKVPTLGVVGTLDHTLAEMQQLKNLRPQMKLVLVEGASHTGATGIQGLPELIAAVREFIAAQRAAR